jgi:hypothetical protein
LSEKGFGAARDARSDYVEVPEVMRVNVHPVKALKFASLSFRKDSGTFEKTLGESLGILVQEM